MKTLKNWLFDWVPLMGMITGLYCILYLLSCLFLGENVLNSIRSSLTTVRPGQVWVYTIDDGDPFRAPMHNTNTVIEVRKGFVKYVGVGDMWLMQGTNSDEASMFKHGSVKIK